MSWPDRITGTTSRVIPLPIPVRSSVPASETELALEADLAQLGDLLARVLREQEGDALPALMSEILALAKRARAATDGSNAGAAEALRTRLAALDSDDALPLARA